MYSLPSRYGIGEFSKEAFLFIDYLKELGINKWKIFSLKPIDHLMDESCSALEEAYISLDDLYSRELISKPIPYNETKKYVSYEDVIRLKRTYYLEAYFNYTSKYGLSEIIEFGVNNASLKKYALDEAKKDVLRAKQQSRNVESRMDLFTNYHLFLQMILKQEYVYIVNHAKDEGIIIEVVDKRNNEDLSLLDVIKFKGDYNLDNLDKLKKLPKIVDMTKFKKKLRKKISND